DFIELEIRQAASDFSTILNALLRSFSFFISTSGIRVISLIINLPSTFSSLPLALALKLSNSSFEFSAIARKVVIRQLLTAATSRCSGDQMPAIPFGNSGGVATSIVDFNAGES